MKNIECLILSESVYGQPAAFIKNPNKIYLKRAEDKKSTQEQFDSIFRYCVGLCQHFENVFIKSTAEMTQLMKDEFGRIDNLHFKQELSNEMEEHVLMVLMEKENPTSDSLVFKRIEYKGEKFLIVDVKVGLKMYSIIRQKRLAETEQTLFCRVFKSIMVKERFGKGFNISVSDEQMFSFVEKMKLKLKNKLSLIGVDENACICQYQHLFEHKIKNVRNSDQLKQTYVVDESEISNYQNGLVIYTDGSVFNDGQCGVGIVMVQNNEVICQLGKKVENNLTSNHCESFGILTALEYIKDHAVLFQKYDYIEIRTDSLNCADQIGIGSTIAKTQEILELIESLDQKIVVRWNKGHSGIEYNDLADELARKVCIN